MALGEVVSSPQNTPNRTDGSDTAQRKLRALDAPTADAITVTRTVTGNAVLARIGDVLAELLPYVPRDDAFRFDLEALAAVAGCSSRALRAPLQTVR
jgi:hypothetical protein